MHGGTCKVPANAKVAYGVDGKYDYKTTAKAVACNTSEFKDVAKGKLKGCWYEVIVEKVVEEEEVEEKEEVGKDTVWVREEEKLWIEPLEMVVIEVPEGWKWEYDQKIYKITKVPDGVRLVRDDKTVQIASAGNGANVISIASTQEESKIDLWKIWLEWWKQVDNSDIQIQFNLNQKLKEQYILEVKNQWSNNYTDLWYLSYTVTNNSTETYRKRYSIHKNKIWWVNLKTTWEPYKIDYDISKSSRWRDKSLRIAKVYIEGLPNQVAASCLTEVWADIWSELDESDCVPFKNDESNFGLIWGKQYDRWMHLKQPGKKVYLYIEIWWKGFDWTKVEWENNLYWSKDVRIEINTVEWRWEVVKDTARWKVVQLNNEWQTVPAPIRERVEGVVTAGVWWLQVVWWWWEVIAWSVVCVSWVVIACAEVALWASDVIWWITTTAEWLAELAAWKDYDWEYYPIDEQIESIGIPWSLWTATIVLMNLDPRGIRKVFKKFLTDDWTILKNKDLFQPTSKLFQWNKVYIKKDNGYYYYRDNLHKDHLEVFNKKWKYVWEADPVTWIVNTSKEDKTKSIKDLIK